MLNGFADEQGNTDKSFPEMHWLTEFRATEKGSKVEVRIEFDSEADLKKIVQDCTDELDSFIARGQRLTPPV